MASVRSDFQNENVDTSQAPAPLPMAQRKRRSSIMITSKGIVHADDENTGVQTTKRQQRMSLGGNKRVSFGVVDVRVFQKDTLAPALPPAYAGIAEEQAALNAVSTTATAAVPAVAPLGVRRAAGSRLSTEFVDAKMDMVFENADAEAEAELLMNSSTASTDGASTSASLSGASPSPRRGRVSRKSASPAATAADANENQSPYALRPRSPAKGSSSTPQDKISPATGRRSPSTASVDAAFGGVSSFGNSPSMSVDISVDFSAAAAGNSRIKFRPLAAPSSPGALFSPADPSAIAAAMMSPAAPVVDLSRRVSLNASNSSEDMSLNGMELTRNFGAILSAVQAQNDPSDVAAATASHDLPDLKSLVDDDRTLPASALPSPASLARIGQNAMRWSAAAYAANSPAGSSVNMSVNMSTVSSDVAADEQAEAEHDQAEPSSLEALLADDHTLNGGSSSAEAAAIALQEHAAETLAQDNAPASLSALVDDDYTLHAQSKPHDEIESVAAPTLSTLLGDDVTLAVSQHQVAAVSPFAASADEQGAEAPSLTALVSDDVTIAVSSKPKVAASPSRFSALDADDSENDASDDEEGDDVDADADEDADADADEDEDEQDDDEQDDEQDDDAEPSAPTDLQALVADDVTLAVPVAYRRVSGGQNSSFSAAAMSPAAAMQLGYATAAAAAAASPYAHPYLVNMMAAAAASSPATAAAHRLSGSFFASPAPASASGVAVALHSPAESTQSPAPAPAPLPLPLSQLVSEDYTMVAPKSGAASSSGLAASVSTPAGSLFANAFTPINALTPSSSFATPASTSAATPFETPSSRLVDMSTSSASDTSAEPAQPPSPEAVDLSRPTLLQTRAAWQQQQAHLAMQQEVERRQSGVALAATAATAADETNGDSMDTSDATSSDVVPLQVNVENSVGVPLAPLSTTNGDAPIQWAHPSMQPSTPAGAFAQQSVSSAFRRVDAAASPAVDVAAAAASASASKTIGGGRASMAGDATVDVRARLMKAEYAKILFGGGDDTTQAMHNVSGTFNIDNMSEQTRQLVAEHARILAAELVAAEVAAASSGKVATPTAAAALSSTSSSMSSSTLLPHMSATTLALLGVPSPAQRVATTPASMRRPPTFNSSQRKQRASPAAGALHATPSVSLTAAMLARRMSFNTAVQGENSLNASHAAAATAARARFAAMADDDDEAAALAFAKENNVDADADVDSDAQDDGSGALTVAAFFRACDIYFASRATVTRQSAANGFVQRDAVQPPRDAREAMQRCIVEATELDVYERASTRWQGVMEQLKTNVEEATQFFMQQPPPVMQMLALVPEEQRPAFVDCMQQQQQKCVAESRWQSARLRVEDETEALALWNAQLTAVRADLGVAQNAVDALDARCAALRDAHTHFAQRAAAAATLASARRELAAQADDIEAAAASARACDAQAADANAHCDAARIEAAAAHAEVEALTEQFSLEARKRAAERAAAEARQRAAAEAALAATRAKQQLRAQCALLQAACGSYTLLDEAAVNSVEVDTTVEAPLATLAFGANSFHVAIVRSLTTGALSIKAAVHEAPASIDRTFVDVLLRSARLDVLECNFNAGDSLKQRLPSLVREIDTRLGRAADLLDEIVRMQTEHAMYVTFPSATKLVVSLMHTGDSSMQTPSAASIAAQLDRMLLGDATSPAPRIEVEFEVSAQYPYAPLGRRLLRAPHVHDEVAALGDAHPERLVQRVVDSTHGFERLTKICLALRRRIPAAYLQ